MWGLMIKGWCYKPRSSFDLASYCSCISWIFW